MEQLWIEYFLKLIHYFFRLDCHFQDFLDFSILAPHWARLCCCLFTGLLVCSLNSAIPGTESSLILGVGTIPLKTVSVVAREVS